MPEALQGYLHLSRSYITVAYPAMTNPDADLFLARTTAVAVALF